MEILRKLERKRKKKIVIDNKYKSRRISIDSIKDSIKKTYITL